jgi:propanol-preferring alcohol dehydrogenase
VVPLRHPSYESKVRDMKMESWDVTEWGKPLQQRIREVPVPKGSEVLIRVTHCGVCHSDVHLQEGYFDLGGGNRMQLSPIVPLPATLGHEIVGEVLSAGPEAGDLKSGTRYLVNPWTGCAECALCLSDEDHLCPKGRALGVGLPGGYASHVIVPHPKYLVDISGLDAAQAAPLACSGITSYGAIRKIWPLQPQEWVAVIGCGGLGLTAVAILRALGHDRIIACDLDDTKLEAARNRGATEVCNISGEGGKRLQEVAGGPIANFLDFVGTDSSAGLALALAPAQRGSRYVVVGLMGGKLQIPIPVLVVRQISVQGSYVGSPSELRELVALARDGRLPLAEVVRRPLAEVQHAINALVHGTVVGRQVLEVG